MGAAKDLWMAEIERVQQSFVAGVIDRDEAVGMLRGLGFDRGEIADMLDEIEVGAGGLK